MFFEHREFWIPKDAGHPEEYQDAFECDPKQGVAALADGVSSSLFSGSWARLLVRGVVRERFDVGDSAQRLAWLNERRQAWRDPINPQALSWHQKPKFQAGAQATLVWLELTRAEAGFQLRCYAVGDSCLFQVNDNQVQRAFPLEDSRLFSENPQVLASVAQANDEQSSILLFEDECPFGQMLVLCSDALAAWAITELEHGRNPDWERQWSMSLEDWRDWITELRAANQIRYDDTTVLLLRLTADPASRKPPVVEQEPIVIDTHPAEAGDATSSPEESTFLEHIHARLSKLPGWRRSRY